MYIRRRFSWSRRRSYQAYGITRDRQQPVRYCAPASNRPTHGHARRARRGHGRGPAPGRPPAPDCGPPHVSSVSSKGSLCSGPAGRTHWDRRHLAGKRLPARCRRSQWAPRTAQDSRNLSRISVLYYGRGRSSAEPALGAGCGAALAGPHANRVCFELVDYAECVKQKPCPSTYTARTRGDPTWW